MTTVQLSKLAYGLTSPELADEIIAHVRATDASFSKKSNAREIQAISVGALEKLTEGSLGWTEGCHAVLALEGCGQRRCSVDEGLAGRMESRRRAIAVAQGQFDPPAKLKVPQIDTSDLDGELPELAGSLPSGGTGAADALQKLVSSLKTSVARSQSSLVAAMNNRLTPMYQELEQRRNETDLLWWVISEWSHLIDKPLADLTTEARALLVGLDLGDLSDLRGGPPAVSTFIDRSLFRSQKGKKTASLKDIIGALDLDGLEQLRLSNTLDLDVTVFPVTGSLQRRLDRRADANEASLFEGIEEFDIDKKHALADWAIHVFHERALARSLAESE